MLKTEKEKNHDSSTLGATYIQKLVNLLQILFSYGVCLPNSSNSTNNSQKDLLLECFGSRRKLNNIFLDSIIENLALSFSQIRGYVHFMNKKVASDALHINGGAIGISYWLLTPELPPESMIVMLVNIKVGRYHMITIELLLD